MGASVTISIEIELGWGTHDRGAWDHLSRGCRKERAYLARLLRECERYEIPVSFDVVGHLLLASCDGEHEGPYPDGWFDADPGTDVERNPAFYAPDVVRKIDSSTVEHELCTHTFSHVLCDRMSDETVRADLDRAQRRLRSSLGSRAVSFVPPRHAAPPSDAVRATGIEIVRRAVDTQRGSDVGRYLELLADPPTLPEPEVVDGIVETYCTSYPSLVAPSLPQGQRSPHVGFRYLPVSLRQRLQRRRLEAMLEQAIETGASLHLWCHLYDLANEYQFPAVADFLELVAEYRDSGQLEALRMVDLNDRERGRPTSANPSTSVRR